jgi:hypothetical protein
MKKIAFAAALSLLAQVVPANAISLPPPSEHYPGAVIAIIGTTLGSMSSTDTANETIAKGEFEQLNSILENTALLTQTAGGSMSTLDILK